MKTAMFGTLPRGGRLARGLALVTAVVTAMTLLGPAAQANIIPDGHLGCPSGINTPGCTHYYINSRGQQVPKSAAGRGIMVGGSEVQVLSSARVQVTTPVRVSPSRYAYRTSTVVTHNNVTRPSRQELTRNHRLTPGAANTIMSTVRWVSNPTSVPADFIPDGRLGCPSGINRPGCTHYYINNRGQQVPKSAAGRGIMVGGSEVRVLSGFAVTVTTPVAVSSHRYVYRTTALKTYKTVTMPTREQLTRSHGLTTRAANTIMSTVRWAYLRFTKPLDLTGATFHLNSSGVPISNLTVNGSRIRAVSRTAIQVTTRLPAADPLAMYVDVTTTIRTSVRESDKRIITTPSQESLRQRHGLSRRASDVIFAAVRSVWHQGRDIFYADRNGKEVAEWVAGGIMARITFLDPHSRSIVVSSRSDFGVNEFHFRGRPGRATADTFERLINRIERQLVQNRPANPNQPVPLVLGPAAQTVAAIVGGTAMGGLAGAANFTSNPVGKGAALGALATTGLALGLLLGGVIAVPTALGLVAYGTVAGAAVGAANAADAPPAGDADPGDGGPGDEAAANDPIPDNPAGHEPYGGDFDGDGLYEGDGEFGGHGGLGDTW